MHVRVKFGRGLIRLGAFIQSLAVAVMGPDDLVEFSRQSYIRPADVEAWAEDGLVDSGLNQDERELLGAIPVPSGDLLLLGVGGGREAIPLARMGFSVTGVDYVPAMVERAIENAACRGVQIGGLVQEFSRLDVPAGAYDVVWLSRFMYSCVPTRARRVAMVRRIAGALKPGGFFLCQFRASAGEHPSGRGDLVRRAVAACIAGNLAHEPGDMLWQNIEFVHEFSSEAAVRSEIEEGGLSIVRIELGQGQRGNAVCRKSMETGRTRGPVADGTE